MSRSKRGKEEEVLWCRNEGKVDSNPGCPPDCSVILEELLNLVELQFSYLQNGGDNRTSYLK